MEVKNQVAYNKSNKLIIITVKDTNETLPDNGSVILVGNTLGIPISPIVGVNNTTVAGKTGINFDIGTNVPGNDVRCHNFEYIENGKLIVISVSPDISFDQIIK